MGLLSPLALVSPIVKPTMDSLQMMKGSYRLLKQSKVFVNFTDRALLDISRIELYVQSAFIYIRFYKFGSRSNQTALSHKLLRCGMIVCDGAHQVIQWELRYQVVHRIYQFVNKVLWLLEFARIVPPRNGALNMDWHSRLPQADLYCSLGGLGLRSINAYTKQSLFKYFRVAVDGLSFYADWKASPKLQFWSNILKDISYLVKASEDIYKIWNPDSKMDTKKGVAGRIIQTLPFIIVPSVSLYRAFRP